MLRFVLEFVFLLAASAPANAQVPVEGDWIARDFAFHNGDRLPQVRLHYRTLGSPSRGPDGRVNNAVLIMHGTGGSGAGFFSGQFAKVLFGAGQPLDASKYYLILPDAIGHGGSSKPSDGLRAKFPRYAYHDMVRAQYLLVRDGLGVDHLRLVMGTSMGGMHTWLWGETYPEFMDALMPLASAPVEIGGRNRMFRKMVIDAIRSDPEWKGGNYTRPPRGLIAAHYALFMMTSSPWHLHDSAPTRDMADGEFEKLRERALKADANNMLYAYESSRYYNPAPKLEAIRAPLVAINSADDEVNPPELGVVEKNIQRVKRGRYVLIPVSPETYGHGTHSRPAVWKQHLIELLAESGAPARTCKNGSCSP